ncbi:hypothetical protein GE21DRAFT_8480 [Neurospora crassa]|uniref:Secreted protein n=2 Tax=Neurospora crassa TaxID=5141 RepID=Q1K5U5_NEUCR|nr:hypothetical protein NCU07201 [Neurospora crassa OR74A]EAA28190.1 hypothetical protein NCU07201 [Neurospora crassa OR74A]KHE85768.1 hypothetical protein GE21DRAFT_8480 [Neurospora crassa]CAD71081.1 putative protein [Neurospora crassa]|eukprot:XP_957426.1 hypothetical protein NCU07201 [Neurospora crassa OR74A]
MHQRSFKSTAKCGATSTKTALLGLLMAAPGVWVQAAPGVSLDAVVANKLETKSLDSSSIIASKPKGDDGDDPWLMPANKFYDNYLDNYWANRNQSSVHGRSSLAGMAHRKRTVPKYDSALYCGVFATGYKEDISALLWDFHTKQNIIHYIVGWRECRRVACKNTSGIYICNDTTQTVRVTGERIYTLGKIPSDNCCHQGPPENPTKKVGHGMSGQKFTGTGFNVIVAYANCNKGEWDYRPQMGPADNPWGPNLECYTEFYGMSPSPTNGDVVTKRGTTELKERKWELVDDGTGVMDLVERENTSTVRENEVGGDADVVKLEGWEMAKREEKAEKRLEA